MMIKYEVGTRGDKLTKEMLTTILEEGCKDKNPRPKYHDVYKDSTYNKNANTLTTADGEDIKLEDNQEIHEFEDRNEIWTPAHTISINHAMLSYDLTKGETPLLTIRNIATKASIAELLWIYQYASNDLVLFDQLLGYHDWDEKHEIHNWWEEWALRDEEGNYLLNEEGHPHIGATYGEVVRRHCLTEQLLEGIKKDPDGRRHIINLWQEADYKEPHGLKPCAFMTQWNVRHGKDGIDYLDMVLTQRSSDFVTAGSINQFQYIVFQHLVAKHLGYVPGKFSWQVNNVQIYDRHVKAAFELLRREGIDCTPVINILNNENDFYSVVPDDIKLEGYPRKEINEKNPQLKLDIGI